MSWARGDRTLLEWVRNVLAEGSLPAGDATPVAPLLQIAARERVLPLLSIAPAPSSVSVAASRASLATGVRNAVLLDLARRASLALAGESIRVMLLKGVDLCERTYGNPSLRPMHDIDLLVPHADRARAVEALSRAGLAPIEPLPTGGLRNSVVLTGGAPLRAHVHLHWHLVNASYPLPYAPNVDLAGLWGRSLPWPTAPDAARVPSVEDLAVYLCEHLVKHCCEEWIFAVDLLLTLRRLRPDPLAFSRIARTWGVERLCESALRIVEGLFPGLGAGEFRERAGGASLTFAEHLFVRQVLLGRRSPGMNWLVYLAHCPTAGSRARQLWKGVFPDPADLEALDPHEVARGRWRAYAMRGWKAVRRVLGR